MTNFFGTYLNNYKNIHLAYNTSSSYKKTNETLNQIIIYILFLYIIIPYFDFKNNLFYR